ncbi:uncharacterized protein PHALS_14992 [Plasmopara halstedii]|uniref:Uncharacterized protein n=1 Tax=Plasmopara halstedii TaxID=4781 RepID=A0A0P1A9R9_PLAHL|nr:uncharacterized protein PHALS_14992 [Plasmopara halstedii]CEG36944.1 hypothetical protein PHALS_14992 [Plasmopara halstedii]|eukprot:XP_024573313.1 hypothetical protein PHALS_14992 [Plasmopara halstedii]
MSVVTASLPLERKQLYSRISSFQMRPQKMLSCICPNSPKKNHVLCTPAVTVHRKLGSSILVVSGSWSR